MRRSSFPGKFFSLSLLALTLTTATAHAVVKNRITKAIGEGTPVALPHTIPARALAASDVGAAPESLKLTDLSLSFNRSAAQQADLDQLLVDLQNPASPQYHQWLTPAQFGARFGLSTTDLSKVTSWLTSQGFTVNSIAASNNQVSFSGTVAQAQQAFGTTIHALTLNGEQHFGNLTDPILPEGISGVVTTITGLNDFKLQSRARFSTIAASTSDALHPQFTSSQTGNHYVSPGDFNAIYDVNNLLNTSNITGQAITIAVLGQTDISNNDWDAFRSAASLPAFCVPTTANSQCASQTGTILPLRTIRVFGTDPGTSSGDLGEAQLDVEWSGAIAKNANILYVNSHDVLGISMIQAITNNLAPIITISYGLCESAAGTANLDAFNQFFQQANAQGQTILGPTGDSGATDCDYNSATASQGLAIDFPSSSPFVTAVGGTMFNEGTTTGGTTYWNAATNSTVDLIASAKGYIPEVPWNASSTGGLASGGGGFSSFFTKPAWQVGPGVPADFARDIPDVSLNAAASHDGYLYCSSGSCTNGFRNAAGSLNVVGGTSVSTPAFASILALVEQKTGSRIGNANPVIYGLAGGTSSATIFHDITSGSNSSPCAQGTPNCPNGGSIGYTAGVGYDRASGWGTIDALNLVNNWAAATPTGIGSTTGTLISATSVTTTSALCAVTASVSLSITVVNGTFNQSTGVAIVGPIPSGTVQILVDNLAVGSPVTLDATGKATTTFSTATLASGGHAISAVYSGSTTYASSRGAVLRSNGAVASVDVISSSAKDFGFTPCTPQVTVKSGAVATGVTFTVTPANGFTGTVTFSANSDTAVSANYTFAPTTVTISSTSAATTSFTLTAYQSSAKGVMGQLAPATMQQSRNRIPWYAAGSGATFACLFLIALPRRRRWAGLLAVLLSVAVFGASGCGSSTSSSGGGTTPTITNATPGTYNITVSAVSGTTVHSAIVTFVVQVQ